ncbi:MAG: STAS domain-containing protein [Streptosporangiaceae bacterium]|nr:STAS domain-containing protein [Streptosporangiaceae bacterium]
MTVIALDGSLDSGTAPGAQEDLERLMADGQAIVLDMSRMSYMSSAGLRILLLVHRRTEEDGTKVALASVPAEIRAVMEATGFLDFFEVCDTVDDGVEVLT